MNRNTGMLLGFLVAPLPMAALTLAVLAVTVGFSESLVVFLVLAYVLVLVPVGISHGVARWIGSRRLLAYAATTFAVTFIVALSGWQLLEFSEDSSLSIELSDGVEQPVPLPVAGAIVAVLFGAIEVACVTVFWLLAIRGRHSEEVTG